jgi:CPA2 family monovalent cation:H+ antiporter-2
LVDKVRQLFPGLEIMVRAENRFDAYEYMDKGIQGIYRETSDTAVRLGIDVLTKLGRRRYSALRAGQKFLKYDEQAVRELAEHRHDRKAYIFKSKQQIELQEELLANDRKANPALNDHAWDRDPFAAQPSADDRTGGSR